MKKIKIISVVILMFAGITAWPQTMHLSLDSCRALAISNNKDLKISAEKIKAAEYSKKSAFTKYFPAISATGAYLRNEKEISILNESQKSALNNIGTNLSNSLGQTLAPIVQGILTQHPELGALIGQFPAVDLATPLNGLGASITDAFRTDTRNMYGGLISLKQPLYMGGKIMAYNKITRYAEQLAKMNHDANLEEVILLTDQAYWQVVSLVNKKELAEDYLGLLKKMESDIDKMIETGVATKADGLSVKVKTNEAEMTLTQVEDGLTLSRMLLCQICGIPLDADIKLEDETARSLQEDDTAAEPYEINAAIDNRTEIKQLTLASNIYDQKVKIARSEYLPNLAFTGNYLFTNPALVNGFEKKMRGMWNFGVVLNVPLCNWGGGVWKTKAAKSEAVISKLQLQDAREKIELQINQTSFKVNEARKKQNMAKKNLEKAEENLRYATLGFEEGVIAPSNTLEAHTAWLKANSEYIDAQIEVKMTKLYLDKALGRLIY